MSSNNRIERSRDLSAMTGNVIPEWMFQEVLGCGAPFNHTDLNAVKRVYYSAPPDSHDKFAADRRWEEILIERLQPAVRVPEITAIFAAALPHHYALRLAATRKISQIHGSSQPSV